MKIGIITIHKSSNYGACLQSYALWKYISSLGCNCEIIDLHRPIHPDFILSKKYVRLRAEKPNLFRRTLLFIKHSIKKGKKVSIAPFVWSPELKEKFKEFNSQIKFSRPYRSIDELYESPPDYDIYVSGSDQIWNPKMPYCIEPYFLTFVNNDKKKISYASSVGISSLFPKEKEKYKQWLSSYDFISVREKTGVKLLRQITGFAIEQVCDPTMLLNREQWEIQKKPITVKNKYILLFSLAYDKEAVDSCLKLAEESRCELIYLSVKQPLGDISKYTVVTNAGPGEWLSYIQNAELVITDSFHGTVFSIILHTKNFYSFVMKGSKNGSRIMNLLSTFALDSHFIKKFPMDSFDVLMGNSIDYHAVESMLEHERERSIDYLKKALLA